MRITFDRVQKSSNREDNNDEGSDKKIDTLDILSKLTLNQKANTCYDNNERDDSSRPLTNVLLDRASRRVSSQEKKETIDSDYDINSLERHLKGLQGKVVHSTVKINPDTGKKTRVIKIKKQASK